MGSTPSKGMKRTPSAAFGRLRIDSPKATTPGSGRSSLSHRRQLRMQHVDVGGGRETSPLLTSPDAARLLSGSGGDDTGHGSDLSYLSSPAIGSPPMAVWIAPALCCAMAYALYNIFIKKGSASINPVLGGVILQLVAAVLGLVLLSLLVYCSEGGAEDVLVYDGAGVRWAVLAGISVGCAEIVSFFVSSLGVQAMQSIPVIIGGSVMFGTTIGAIVLKEELTCRGWAGVVMISVGIGLVGLDDAGGGE